MSNTSINVMIRSGTPKRLFILSSRRPAGQCRSLLCGRIDHIQESTSYIHDSINNIQNSIYYFRDCKYPGTDRYSFDYSWMDENCLIAHGFGGIDGSQYTNSREALEQSYDKGYRVFECDFQIIDQQMLDSIMKIYPFNSVVYTLYTSLDSNDQVLNFCAASGIGAVTMPYKRADTDDEFVNQLDAIGVRSLVHMLNDKAEMEHFFDIGVDMIYTDFAEPAEFAGRVG